MATTSNTITATAGQTEFSFSFPYLKKESIKVTIDTVATTAFTIPDNNPTTVVLNSGATAGQVIVISRVTSTTATPATFFSGGAFRAQDLNDNFDSILYITQEKENQLTEVIAGGIADGSITSSKLADQSVGTSALIDTAVIPSKLDRSYLETAGGTVTGPITFASGAHVNFDSGANPTFNASGWVHKPFYYDLDPADLATGPSQIASGQYKQDASVYLGTGAARIQQDNAANLTLSKNFANNSTGSKVFVNFMRKGLDYGTITAKIGSIAFPDSRVIYQGDLSGTATPTSDYRLKDDVTLLEDGTAIVKQLRPVTFKWNYDPDSFEIGFIAHEVAEVIPSVVRGKKDEVKEDGSPEYQGVNYAGVVPALTKALQEALVRIEALEAKVQTLENN